MKFYDCATAPSPRRLRMFIAEKGIEIPTVQVDLRNGEQFSDSFRRINPWCTVPALELDDGTVISEVIACCRYLEEIHSDPPLMGIDAADKGVVAMWEHRCEWDGFLAAAEALRNAVPGLKRHALTGRHEYEQIPALAERGFERLGHFHEALNERLAVSEFVAGPRFTVADITAFIAVEMAVRREVAIPASHGAERRWFDAVSARPSAKA